MLRHFSGHYGNLWLALNWSLVELSKMKELWSCNLIRTMILIDTLFQCRLLKGAFQNFWCRGNWNWPRSHRVDSQDFGGVSHESYDLSYQSKSIPSVWRRFRVLCEDDESSSHMSKVVMWHLTPSVSKAICVLEVIDNIFPFKFVELLLVFSRYFVSCCKVWIPCCCHLRITFV